MQMTCSACEREIKATLAGVNGNQVCCSFMVILVVYAAVRSAQYIC